MELALPSEENITGGIRKMKYSCIIVEDEVLIRNNLAKKINICSNSYDLLYEAKNGKDALDYIKSMSTLPSLVLTDIKMPICDGLELTRELYYNFPKIKVVLISGYDNFTYAQQAIKYHVHDYLLKPITDSLLTECLLNIKMKLDTEINFTQQEIYASQEYLSAEKMIRIVREYLLLHYREEIDWELLSEKFNFSLSYLRKIFKQETSYTPTQYLTFLRMNEAKNLLLKAPDVTISAIGKIVGYEDQYYFSRIFKKQTGCYPSDYRTNNNYNKLES